MRMGIRFKHAVQVLLGKFDYRLMRTYSLALSSPLDPFFGTLKRNGFAPRYVIDVGAHKGGWTRRAIEYWPQAKYTLLEPQSELKVFASDLLDRYEIEWIESGVADESGQLDFTIASQLDASTFCLSEKQAKANGLARKCIDVVSLNDLVRTRGGQMPDMLKIDAEGFDLKVLAGASELLERTEVVLVEAAVVADMENTFDRVHEKMSASGYRLIDITDINRSPRHGALWLVEVAFLKKTSTLLAGVDSYD